MDYLDPDQAAAFLASLGMPTAKATLAKWRCVGGGPAFQYFGRRIRYRKDRLVEFAEARISPERQSTSEAA
jgi:hypothetical protein